MRSKFNKLLEKIDRTAHSVAIMERSLDCDHGDNEDPEWRTSREIALSKKIISLNALQKAMAMVCKDDIRELRKIEASQAAKQERRERHEELMLAQANARLKIEEHKTRQAELANL